MQGLEFLHSHGVIVMDIKPDNIFCNYSSTFQIGDFGMAVVSSLNWVRLPRILNIRARAKHDHAYRTVQAAAPMC